MIDLFSYTNFLFLRLKQQPYRIEMDYDSINSVLSKSFIIDNSENESNSNGTSKNSPNQGKYAKRIESLKPRISKLVEAQKALVQKLLVFLLYPPQY